MLRKGMIIGDRYEILEKVGSGGMSDVYKAKCHKLNRFVAVKVLKQEFSEDKNFVTKFKVEAQSAAGLAHPNIVNVYDVGEDNGLYYIVMELIEGITLKQYIARKGRLTVKETISIAIQVAQGIECAHNNQIIHRDIKPQNIIISKEGKVKVTDFGIARAASANTINSNAMGSVHYISPEQARGGYIDEKSDIYSLGITMFEMLTGSVPFDGESTVAIALQHIQNDIPNLKELLPDIPISVENIVYKCTQKKADRRYLKISSLIADLKKALINPDEDFVQFVDFDTSGATVMISDEEVSQIRKEAGNVVEDSPVEEFDDDDIDAVNPKLDKIITIGGIVAGIIVIIAAIFIVKEFVIGTENSGGNEVKTTPYDNSELDDAHVYMPNVLGATEDEAYETLHSNSLGIVYEYEYNETYDKGLVCAQSEEAGTVVEKNITVTVTISQGAERIEVPNIIGSSLEDAIETLNKAGLLADIQYEYSGKSIGTVLSTDPTSEQTAYKGDTITLTVSRGSKYYSTTTVPNIVGLKLSKAESKLEDSGLDIGNIRYEYSDTVAKGKVIRQTVKSGNTLPLGSSVGVVVSEGPLEPETTTPEVTTPEVTTPEETTTPEPATPEETTIPESTTQEPQSQEAESSAGG